MMIFPRQMLEAMCRDDLQAEFDRAELAVAIRETPEARRGAFDHIRARARDIDRHSADDLKAYRSLIAEVHDARNAAASAGDANGKGT